ncbi:B-cell receptor-associated 31-like protein [Rhizodiscina lignyota]|uniref:Endoplasmic reticulum transmembrane protein n=1 Tax=Rhizodiscina lignyota TaxID=1504668 RepID=A0A9P4IJ71_9PEZI|nr:B-cell receptor-associated 31-like protein [Rhizodiscina lignyota]
MTLYYSMVFALLVFEMLIFVSLIIPLPLTIRRKLFTFLSESPLIAKLQYGMKITFIFILILFLDSVNRVYRVQLETAAANKSQGSAEAFGGTARMEIQARKFYSQRNMYLCGFTLFLSLILNRTYVMILDVLRLEEEVKRLKGEGGAKGDTAAKLGAAGAPGEIGKLRKENEALKSQMEGLSREYNRLGDEKGGADGTPKKDR